MPWVSRALVRWRPLHLQPLNPSGPRLSIAPQPAHTLHRRSLQKEERRCRLISPSIDEMRPPLPSEGNGLAPQNLLENRLGAAQPHACRWIGEHTRLACNCPASSPDRFRDEAGDIAAVLFAMRMIGLSYPSLPLRLRQSAIVPGVDAGHHTRGRVCSPCSKRRRPRLRNTENVASARN